MSETATGTGPADATYWRALAEGRLMMQRCQGCGRWQWPAVFRCGDCGSWDPPWFEVAMEGRVFSWTKSWHAFGGVEGIGLPFVTVVAELPQAGGRRLMGIYEGDESRLELGLALKGVPGSTRFGGEDLPSIKWSPA